MKIFLICILMLYILFAIKGYPLVRKYSYEKLSERSRDNPLSSDYKGDRPIPYKSMEANFNFKKTRTLNWVIPGLYDHEQYAAPYTLDLHINSKTIDKVSNFRFELTTDDGQQVVYIPKEGTLALETGPHLTVFSRHIDPLESAPDLNWDGMKNLTLTLEYTVHFEGKESPIKIIHTYEKTNNPSIHRNPLFSDIFLNI